MDGNALLWAGVVGPLLFILVFLVDGATRPGYRPTYHVVSALSNGPRGWIQRTNFIVWGTLMVAAAWGILTATDSIWLAAVVAAIGLAVIASGIFSMDPMRGYPPGTPANAPPAGTMANRLHDRAGVVIFAGFPITATVAAFTLESTPWVIWSVVAAVATAIALFRFITAFERDHPWTGLFQKLDIIVGWVWLATVCAHLA